MRDYLDLYINGAWVKASSGRTLDVENPATGEVAGRIGLADLTDLDAAVAAARAAFPTWSATSVEERIAMLQSVLAVYQKRFGDLVEAVTEEMGAPRQLAQEAHVPVGMGHIMTTIEVLKSFPFEEDRGAHRIVREPIGVCGFITPWNWPLNQMMCKIAPALATGCTMVLKPSEIAPFSAQIVAEILHEAGVPAGVFNLVYGEGADIGSGIASHPDIDMVSFTGSTRAGVLVAQNAAPTVKRVTQELGGKSAHIVLDDEDFAKSVASGTIRMMINSGQSCNAPSRMLVPASRADEALAVASAAAEQIAVGDPTGEVMMGPVASQQQADKIRQFIRVGLEEGAVLGTGGAEPPAGLEHGHYIRPTVFGSVSNDMTIAREEIFGPVLAIISYETLDDAVRIANDTPYGLAAYVSGSDVDKARALGSRLRAGQVIINGARDITAPFGGYKMSGNGREWGDAAFHEFLELKALVG